MYGDEQLLDKAIERKHMVFSEAAAVAADGGSKELWLTHFSPALREPYDFLHFAADRFPNTVIGQDLMTKQLKYID
jgi:ribonuclease Z